MGKPKKGKKGRKDDEFGDDDGDIDVLAEVEAANEEQPEAKQPQGKKGKKGRRKKDDDWEDDVSAEIAALSLQQNIRGDSEEEVEIEQPKQKKRDKKKKKADLDEEGDEMPAPSKTKKGAVSAFMMLDVDDPSEEEAESDQEERTHQPVKKDGNKSKKKGQSFDEPESMDVEEEEPKQQAKGKKKKGKQKNKKEDEEEDFDAILAEFGAAPSKEEPKEEGKKKKKGKKEKQVSVEEAESDAEPEEAGFVVVKDINEMTEEELMKHFGLDEDDEDDKKKKKKGKKQKTVEKVDSIEEEEGELKEDGEEEEESTVKSAAQKKKEKRERQKQKKLEEASRKKKGGKAAEPEKAEPTGEDAAASASTEAPAGDAEKGEEGEGAEGESKKKKRDRKKKGKEEEEKKKKPSKMALALQEMLKKQKEEEERIRLEEEEKERKIEEKRRLKEEKERLERERKEKEKQKKKEKIERLKAEGKYMTAKQKEAQRIAQAKLEALRAQGIDIPSVDKAQVPEKKKRVVYDSRPKKKKFQQQQSEEATPEEPTTPTVEVEVKEAETSDKTEDVADSWDAEPEEEVKDEWDASSEEEEEKQEEKPAKAAAVVSVKKQASVEEEEEEDDDEDDDEDEDSDEDDSEEEDSEEESDSDDGLSAKERARERGLARIQKRKDDAEKKKSIENLRAPVVVVLGHVDTGKTKILDKLRRTNVQDGEAGGITQQIGATNVPDYTIKEQTKMCKDFAKKELKIPGLLIIDTPGHESFSNLRSRGSSLCDIAILVIDIMHGLEPQTIESINLLKAKKTPFVVALNKIDRLFGWQPNPHSDVVNTLKKQKPNTKLEFEERAQQVVVQLAEQGLNAALFHENKNPREYISLIPTSAHSGDGMGNLIALICEFSQNMLAKRLAYSELLAATVMEVKALPGLGTTIDVILVNGSIKEGSTVIVAGQEGPITTQIRGLLLPQPLKELRVKGAYEHVKEIVAAQGVKIIAKDLDKALAGLPLYVAHHDDEVEIYREELSEMLQDILGSIKLSERGVFVQASTLGSLEALLEFLRTSKIPYAGINIGPVHKKDIMKASVMLEHDSQYAVILAFDVKVEREAQEMADSLGVKIFTADIIYHLFDAFMAYREDLKKKKQEEFKHIAVFPCKIRVLPQYIFNSRDPIVCGVIIESGFMKIGTPLCVPSKEFIDLGRVTSLEVNHKPIEKAVKGQEVCIKIEPLPSEAPKMFGRHFDHTDLVYSKISRESIDAVKNYFRDEMTKADWQLIVEMKKLFEIL